MRILLIVVLSVVWYALGFWHGKSHERTSWNKILHMIANVSALQDHE